jgi:hypothetical protein
VKFAPRGKLGSQSRTLPLRGDVHPFVRSSAALSMNNGGANRGSSPPLGDKLTLGDAVHPALGDDFDPGVKVRPWGEIKNRPRCTVGFGLPGKNRKQNFYTKRLKVDLIGKCMYERMYLNTYVCTYVYLHS